MQAQTASGSEDLDHKAAPNGVEQQEKVLQVTASRGDMSLGKSASDMDRGLS
jgi:hypothetical protein